MSAVSYVQGNLVRISMAFTDSAGDDVDPATVNIRVKEPDGTRTTYTYGTDAELVKDAVGNYHFDLDLNAAGEWPYYTWSTGTGQAATHGRIIAVEPQA